MSKAVLRIYFKEGGPADLPLVSEQEGIDACGNFRDARAAQVSAFRLTGKSFVFVVTDAVTGVAVVKEGVIEGAQAKE